MLHERRSPFFSRLFTHLAIGHRLTPEGHIDAAHVLRWEGHSLQLYFNEATNHRGAYFLASRRLYRDYPWAPLWLEAHNDRHEPNHVKVIPYPGEEHSALLSLLNYLSEIGYHGAPWARPQGQLA
jgi:hypothetical protein